VTAAKGGTAVFMVSAMGVPQPSYQWFFNDTNVLPGAAGATLSLSQVQPSQAGFYSVQASNLVGSVTSSRAKLTVIQPPIITNQPQNLVVLQGQPAVFTVAADGPGPLSYQWMANCVRPISGATTSTFRLKNTSATDSGSYCVTVSNVFGTVTSEAAVLRVIVPPKLLSVSRSPDGVSLTFSTVTNLLYTVFAGSDASTTAWSLLPNAYRQVGTGAPMTVSEPGATTAQRFYRILVE
jgi:hypothetical protein